MLPINKEMIDMKKIVALLLSCLLILTAMPVFAAEVTGTCGENLTWEYDSDTGTLTVSGTGDMDDYACDGTPWKEYQNKGICKVVLSEGVTSVGTEAFFQCLALESVELPDTLKEIGDYAFSCTSLSAVELPEGLESIGGYALSSCFLLTEVDIPAKVTYIGHDAFYFCSQLTDIRVDENNPSYSSRDGMLYDKAGTTLIQCPSGIAGQVEIPDGVWRIEDGVFRSCYELTDVVLPDSVKVMGTEMFAYCYNLKSVRLSAALTEIRWGMFKGCSSLSDVEIPANVTVIEREAFSECRSLTSIDLPVGLKTIYEQAFWGCTGLDEVTIPAGVTLLGEKAFYGCTGLTSIDIPLSVVEIREKAFYGCENLKTVHNYSRLHLVQGSSGNGHVACYASEVINHPAPVMGSGDLSGDGWVNAGDMSMLSRFLGGVEALSDVALGNADINGDGNINAADLTVMARSVGGID